MNNNNEINQLIESAEIWHYREVSKRTGKSLVMVKKVLKYKTRKNELIETEFALIVKESQERKDKLSTPKA